MPDVTEHCASDSHVPLNFELVIHLKVESAACLSPISCETELVNW